MEFLRPIPKKIKTIILINNQYNNFCKINNCCNKPFQEEEYCINCIPNLSNKYVYRPIAYKINRNRTVFIGYRWIPKCN